jgi:CheY-like chemotaxis protein
VVLLDIDLPLLNGREVARCLRATPGMEGALLWALTGHGETADLLLCREAGFDLHLVKPFDPDQLRELLAEAAARAACEVS